ncbi:hypothetical protein RR48_02230 [Papilio machaon]|uniref:Uncharacterized protein n=1 Tax=Papilio machaon TaxID=76193 RepID=A0A0N1INX8_PAPMA|nr:hypothetical protein RR48_02230 [Papilio machaon]
MESKVYSSLFALVDSHLSQTSLKESSSNDTKRSLPIPNVKSLAHNGSVSESFLHSPQKRLPIPTLSENNSQILDKLSEQVANMLKAKERREIEEKQKLEEKMNKMETDEQDYVIDLMKALQTPCEPSKPVPEENHSKSSSTESIFELNFNDFDEDIPTIEPEPLLPCVTDMSYILKQKIKRAKCSTFGKVLTSRLKPVPAPYIREKIKSDIVRFDFSTKSPCDIIKEKLRKPTSSCTSNFNIV